MLGKELLDMNQTARTPARRTQLAMSTWIRSIGIWYDVLSQMVTNSDSNQDNNEPVPTANSLLTSDGTRRCMQSQ